MFLSSLLDGSLVPQWVTVSFPIVRYVLVGVMFVSALVIIVTVLMQNESEGGGTNAISGVQESFYQNNKSGTREGKLKRVTITMAIIIAVSIVLYFASLLIQQG
ncbi:MAG: preprotein translocase subunit SecG [Clostridia bacterium]